MTYSIKKNGHTVSNGWKDLEAAHERMHELYHEHFEEFGTTNVRFEIVEA